MSSLEPIAQFAADISARLQPFQLLAKAVAAGQITEDQARSVMISSLNQTISVIDDVVRYLRAGRRQVGYVPASYAHGRINARIRFITGQHCRSGVLFLSHYRVVKPVSYPLKGVYLWTTRPLRTLGYNR